MTDDLILISVADGVADIRLNRPAKRNALDMAMFETIAMTIDDLARRNDIRVVVLSGEGPAFCAGIDLRALEEVAATDLAARTHGPANLFQYAAWGWHSLPVPVIAAVHGVAFGGGLQIALGADIRIAAPDAQFSIMEAKWGLVPDMAGTLLLDGLVRADIARELTYGARIFDGREAAALGFASHLADDPRVRALELAKTIAAGSSAALKAAKRLFNGSMLDVEARLLAESREQQPLIAEALRRIRQQRG